jgi:putative endonuclease
MTDNLVRRVWLHREGAVQGFTKQHKVTMLVWYEQHASRESAFQRERRMKKWSRMWKLREIEAANPDWRDLYEEIAN